MSGGGARRLGSPAAAAAPRPPDGWAQCCCGRAPASFSARQRVAFTLANSTFGMVWDLAQTLLSLLSCAVFIAGTYNAFDSPEVDLALTVIFTADYAVRWYASPDRWVYPFGFFPTVDVLTCAPVYVQLVVTSSPNSVLGFFRFVRVLRVMRVLRLFKVLNANLGAVQRQVLTLIVTVLSMVFLTAGVVSIVETDLYEYQMGRPFDPDAVPTYRIETFGLAVYYLIVTLATVGYGDFVPLTPLGKLVCCTFIPLCIIVIPIQVNELSALFASQSKFAGPFAPAADTPFVLVVGAVENETVLREFLHEVYHPDHLLGLPESSSAAVTLVMAPHEPSEGLRALMLHPLLEGRLRYMLGNAQSAADLERARVESAAAVYLLSDVTSPAPQFSDRRTAFGAMMVRTRAPDVPTFVHNLTSTAVEVLDPVDPNLFVITADDLRARLLARAASHAGAATLIMNLFRCRVAAPEAMEGAPAWQAEFVEGSGATPVAGALPPELDGVAFTALARAVYAASRGAVVALGVHELPAARGSAVANARLESTDEARVARAHLTSDAMAARGVLSADAEAADELVPGVALLNPGPDYRVRAGQTLYLLAANLEAAARAYDGAQYAAAVVAGAAGAAGGGGGGGGVGGGGGAVDIAPLPQLSPEGREEEDGYGLPTMVKLDVAALARLGAARLRGGGGGQGGGAADAAAVGAPGADGDARGGATDARGGATDARGGAANARGATPPPPAPPPLPPPAPPPHPQPQSLSHLRSLQSASGRSSRVSGTFRPSGRLRMSATSAAGEEALFASSAALRRSSAVVSFAHGLPTSLPVLRERFAAVMRELEVVDVRALPAPPADHVIVVCRLAHAARLVAALRGPASWHDAAPRAIVLLVSPADAASVEGVAAGGEAVSSSRLEELCDAVTAIETIIAAGGVTIVRGLPRDPAALERAGLAAAGCLLLAALSRSTVDVDGDAIDNATVVAYRDLQRATRGARRRPGFYVSVELVSMTDIALIDVEATASAARAAAAERVAAAEREADDWRGEGAGGAGGVADAGARAGLSVGVGAGAGAGAGAGSSAGGGAPGSPTGGLDGGASPRSPHRGLVRREGFRYRERRMKVLSSASVDGSWGASSAGGDGAPEPPGGGGAAPSAPAGAGAGAGHPLTEHELASLAHVRALRAEAAEREAARAAQFSPRRRLRRCLVLWCDGPLTRCLRRNLASLNDAFVRDASAVRPPLMSKGTTASAFRASMDTHLAWVFSSALYASGRAVPVDVLHTLLVPAMFTPMVTPLLSALLAPWPAGGGRLQLRRVPREMHGRRFEELVAAWGADAPRGAAAGAGGVVVLGLYRAGGAALAQARARARDEGAPPPGATPAAAAAQCSPYKYVYTLPPPDTRLFAPSDGEGDAAYCLVPFGAPPEEREEPPPESPTRG